MELVKREDRYDLYADDGSKIASTSPNTMKKLSLKNCQAIEQDSPLQEYVLEVNGEGWDDHLCRGSRKQTEWDVEIEMQKHLEGYEMVGHQKGVYGSGHRIPIYNSKPRLDGDGCLILKTFKSE
jgi:hypothetical protein